VFLGASLMLDFTSPIGLRIQKRLEEEETIWLTTIDASHTPQPRPVWFQWDGETVLIFSQANAAKVRHVTRNPHVSLNFNTDEDGGDVGVLIGEAHLLQEAPPPARMQAYLKKYAAGIQDIGLTPESMQAQYSVAILVTPASLRGF
jgi:PPOX class probable F420-dependent enzyme